MPTTNELSNIKRARAIIDDVVHGECSVAALGDAHDLLTSVIVARDFPTPSKTPPQLPELVADWRGRAKRADAEDRADDAYSACADELEATLAAAAGGDDARVSCMAGALPALLHEPHGFGPDYANGWNEAMRLTYEALGVKYTLWEMHNGRAPWPAPGYTSPASPPVEGQSRPQPGSPEFDGAEAWEQHLCDQGHLHPATDYLVERFADALREKLLAAQMKYGYSDDWRSRDWMDECRRHLVQHVAKGDPRDVAAYCAFLWHHGESTATTPPEGRGIDTLCEHLQQKCSDWGTYWRAPDAHGVILNHEQALELLRDALGVEVEIKEPESPPEGQSVEQRAIDPAEAGINWKLECENEQERSQHLDDLCTANARQLFRAMNPGKSDDEIEYEHSHEITVQAVRLIAALSAQAPSEAVAVTVPWSDFCVSQGRIAESHDYELFELAKAWMNAQFAAPQARGLDDGMVLVPREPTKEWVEEAAHLIHDMSNAGTVAADIAISLYQSAVGAAVAPKFAAGDRVTWTNKFGTSFPGTIEECWSGPVRYRIALDDGTVAGAAYEREVALIASASGVKSDG